MTIQLIAAPAAAGKTAFVLSHAQLAARTQPGSVRVCVPTGRQARAMRRRLAKAGGAIGVHVHTFDHLVAACLDAAGAAYTQLADPVEYRLLRTIIDSLPLQHYAPLKTKSGFVQIARDLIAELKGARITPDAFAAAATELQAGPRLAELAQIYAAYQSQLRESAWADRVGLQWLAAEALDGPAPDVGRNWTLLIVDGFDYFTASQLALLQRLAARVGRCIITVPRAANVDFPRYARTAQALSAALHAAVEPLNTTEGREGTHPTLRHLADHLFAPPGAEITAPDHVVRLREAVDRPSEVRAALRWLKQRLVHDGTPADQLALLARDIDPYRPFIRQVAREFGIPIRLIGGEPLEHSPIVDALLSLLRLYLPLGDEIGSAAEPALPHRPVVAAWRSPYFDWRYGDMAIEAADADRLDTLARQHLVIRGLTQWREAFAAGKTAVDRSADADADTDAVTTLDPAAAAALEAKFDHFLACSQPPPVAESMRAYVQWLETLIGPDPTVRGGRDGAGLALDMVAQARRHPPTAAADVAALRMLKEILRGLVWAEAAVGRAQPVTFTEFFQEVAGAVAAARYSVPLPRDTPEIVVAPATDVRGLSFSAVAILGMGEGAFPATLSEDPFLRDEDRRALRARAGFPLNLSTQSAEREFFYEAVTRARDRLLLTRPLLADNGADWVASPFWDAVARLLNLKPERVGSRAVLPAALAASPVEWWETAAANGAPPPEHEPDATWASIEHAAAVWRHRHGAVPNAWDGDLSPLADRLATRFGPDHVWSASRLEAYQTCGFLFLLQNGLDLAPRPEPAEGLDARQLGSLYHDILEQVTRGGLPDPDDEDAVRRHVASIAAPILDAAPADQGFRQTAWWAQTRQEIVDNVVRSAIALADGAYTFDKAEAAFGIKGPPLVVDFGADTLRLRGFIDRVDRHPDGTIRIIDYKLGGKSGFSRRAFEEGKKLQLPLYALAAEQALGLGPVSDGFYWHLQQVERSGFQLATFDGGVPGAVATALEHARTAIANIRAGRFTPQPPEGGCPSYCPAAAFCWHYAPRPNF